MRAVPFFFVFVSLLGLAALENLNLSRDPALAANVADPMTRMLGSTKEVIGDMAFLKADEYFHGGVKREFRHDEGNYGKEGGIEEEGHNPEHKAPADAEGDWIERVNHAIHVTTHRHLEKNEAKELLPFLAAATTLDPYNEAAVLTTAYWLEKNFDRADAMGIRHTLPKSM